MSFIDLSNYSLAFLGEDFYTQTSPKFSYAWVLSLKISHLYQVSD